MYLRISSKYHGLMAPPVGPPHEGCKRHSGGPSEFSISWAFPHEQSMYAVEVMCRGRTVVLGLYLWVLLS